MSHLPQVTGSPVPRGRSCRNQCRLGRPLTSKPESRRWRIADGKNWQYPLPSTPPFSVVVPLTMTLLALGVREKIRRFLLAERLCPTYPGRRCPGRSFPPVGIRSPIFPNRGSPLDWGGVMRKNKVSVLGKRFGLCHVPAAISAGGLLWTAGWDLPSDKKTCTRDFLTRPSGGNGRRSGLKILCGAIHVRVRVPSRPIYKYILYLDFCHFS